METASPHAGALEGVAPETGNPAKDLDWSQPLELVTETGVVLVTLCPTDRLPSFAETNPDEDGDFWLLLPDRKGAQSRFCSDVTGDATPWGQLRNVVAALGPACPADGNLLAEDGICGFCGNAPEAFCDGATA